MRAVTIVLELPEELAAEAEEVHLEEPSFLARVVEIALAERHVYRLWVQDLERSAPELTPEPLHAHIRPHDASRP